jgi:CTP synthase (UTP-ammonia lyase)
MLSYRQWVSMPDTQTIYAAPLILQATGLDEVVMQRFNLQCPKADLSEWRAVVEAYENPEQEVTIAMVGKYMDLLDAYKSLIEAIRHAGIHTRTKVKTRYIDAENAGAKRHRGCWRVWMPSWYLAASVSAALRGLSPLPAMPEPTKFPILAYAWACM